MHYRARITGENVEVIAAKAEVSASTPSLTVETVHNHVYYYAEVNSDRVLALMKAIREVDAQLRWERQNRALPEDYPYTPIYLHINSDGGYVFDGLSAADQLAAVKSPIYSIVEGCAASAATLLSMACTRRFILPQSVMMVHQLSSLHWGTFEQLKDDMFLSTMLMEKLVHFYISRSRLTEEQLREMLKRDTWLDAQKCLELGLVDEVWQR